MLYLKLIVKNINILFVVQFNMSTVGTVNNLNSMYIEREIENVC